MQSLSGRRLYLPHPLTAFSLHTPLKFNCLRSNRNALSPIRMSLTSDGPTIAIAGVTGAVGQEFLSVLSERNFPYKSLKLLASRRSAGKKQIFEGREYEIEELTPESFDGVDIALFSAGGSVSKLMAPIAVEKGVVVVDNSSAFRMDPNVPLVIPEVNADAMRDVRFGKGAIIANPNCSTIICLMAVTPLHRRAKVRPSPTGHAISNGRIK